MLEDCSLWPVQVLKVYLAKTQDKSNDKELLFISSKKGHKGDHHK